MEEIWKDIKFTDTDGKEYDYTGYYQVSNLGRVRSLDRIIHRINNGTLCETNLKGKILKQCKIKGYFSVVLNKNGDKKQFRVHRLVAHMYIINPNPNEFVIINHKDEDPSNNNADNLEWCTYQYNTQYSSYKWSGLNSPMYDVHRYGKSNPFFGQHHTEESKRKQSEARKGKFIGSNNPSARKVKCIETGEIFDTLRDASKAKKCRESNISSCCRGKIKTTGGFHWEYV